MEHTQQSGCKELTAVLENYLEIIFHLEMRDGAARAGAIADIAGVSRPTVTSSLKSLKSLGLVEYSPYSLVRLTDKGLGIGRDIAHRHFVFKELLENVLRIESEQADTVACSLEHVVPPEVIKRIGQFVLFLKSRTEFWEHWQEEYEAENIAKRPHGEGLHTDAPRRSATGHSSPNPYK